MKREINERHKQRATARKINKDQKFQSQARDDSERNVNGIRSSRFVHSEVLQETLEGKHKNSGWYSDNGPQFRSYVLH